MEVSQVHSNEIEQKNEKIGFEFVQVPNDGKLFPNFKAKEVQEKFFQWGLTEKNLFLGKYRFNQSFHLVGADQFLKDLFNDKLVLSTFEPISPIHACNEVNYKNMGA
mmetsp:Transcript_11952/g.11833  ORF Transcript_11952/g.11833 Transcript_11952/m.11833 type:complete len:107 (-) Transcript_11952:62-382(-)